MKVVFLPSSDEDVRWFMRYYRRVFPEGRRNARLQMAKTLEILSRNPGIGRSVVEINGRALRIARTPYTLVYQVTETRIEILRVWDGRANPERLTRLDIGTDQV